MALERFREHLAILAGMAPLVYQLRGKDFNDLAFNPFGSRDGKTNEAALAFFFFDQAVERMEQFLQEYDGSLFAGALTDDEREQAKLEGERQALIAECESQGIALTTEFEPIPVTSIEPPPINQNRSDITEHVD